MTLRDYAGSDRAEFIRQVRNRIYMDYRGEGDKAQRATEFIQTFLEVTEWPVRFPNLVFKDAAEMQGFHRVEFPKKFLVSRSCITGQLQLSVQGKLVYETKD